MTKRTAKFVSAIAASFLVGAPLTTPSHSATADCLSAPKEQTPQGGHWYYRIDRTTKHHCWYLGGEHEKSPQASSSNIPTSKPPIQKSEGALPPAVANARAELPAKDTVELSKQGNSESIVTTMPAGVTALSTEIQSSIIDSRWPDQALPTASVKTSANAIIKNGANPASNPQMASIQKVEPWVTADMPSQAQDDRAEGYSLLFLLAAIAGTLAFAGIVTSLFLRFGGLRTRLQNINRERSDEDSSAHRHGFARTAYPARDRASEFFAQISRQHPT